MVLLDDTARESTPEALIREARERQRRRRRAVTLVAGALLLAAGLFALLGGSGGAAGSSVNRPSPVGIAARAADPAGGPLWGVRLVRARGRTCLQLGRLRGDQLGFLGTDGRFPDDGRFHPFGVSATHQATCAQNDGNGHAFMTIEAGSVPASGSMVGWTGTAGCDSTIEVAGRNRALNRLRRKHIAVSSTCQLWLLRGGDSTTLTPPASVQEILPVAASANGNRLIIDEYAAPAAGRSVAVQLSPRRVSTLGTNGTVVGVGISRNGRTVLLDRGDLALPPHDGVIETVPFDGGQPTWVTTGDSAAWNG
jgi:hypothetical protein